MDLIKSFPSSQKFRLWLEKNYAKAEAIWLCIHKKDSGKKSLTYAEALDEALCYGWIDGQKKSHDESSWLQRFTPRRVKSRWSKVNTQHAERLVKAGRMQSAGLVEMEAAKKDGRWTSAYDSPRNAVPSDEFLKRLDKNKKAKAFFATLQQRNRYAIIYRLQTAKKIETFERRMNSILAMLEKGEVFHP